MRRKPGTLLPLELSILEAAVDLRRRGVPEYHGYLIAKEISEKKNARLLTAHGTLYKALRRMEKADLLASRWEDPLIAADDGRPRRRLYRLTAAGVRASSNVPAENAAGRRPLRQGTAQP